jgi:glycosyltransferase involved in cell wall biosynthesis
MQDNIKVSIIITCYNLEKYIARAINSCINQTLDDDKYEIIVVDDHSTDNSNLVIETYTGLIKHIRLKENTGVANASNEGIRKAKGSYIVRVDGDDYINKNFLLTMTEVLEWNEDIGFVYCDHIIVDSNNERKQAINTLAKLLDHGAGVVFRKDYLNAIGLYDESLRNREDYDLILRYIKNFDGYRVRLPYYRYFQRADSLSKQVDERKKIKRAIDERIIMGKT